MNFIQKNNLELVARMEYITEQTNDLQTIRAYMSNRFENIRLTDQQEFKLKRWQFIYDQLSSGKYTEKEVRHQVVTHFRIDEGTAYKDMRTAQELFSTTLNINKRFKIITDLRLLDLMQLKAREAQDMDAYAKLQKAKNDLYRMLPDEEEVPGDHFEPRQNVLQYNPRLLGVDPVPTDKVRELLKELANEHGITDIDYEIIEDNEAGTDTPQ